MRLTPKWLLVFVLLANFAFSASTPLAETRKKAEAGDAQAQLELGVAHDSGRGVPKDSAEAVKWYRKAAEQGYAKAQNNLGVAYSFGDGVPISHAEAVNWFRKAAEQGDPRSQYLLGLEYALGLGVPKDIVQAHVWYNIAGANGHEQARKDLTDIELKMTPEQKIEAMKLARELFEKLPRMK